LIRADKVNYISGTAAKKIEYDVYEENEILRAKKRTKSSNINKLKTTGYILVIFTIGLVLVYRYALITEIYYGLNILEKEYSEIKNENSRLRVAIETKTDLTQIKEFAEQSLGLQEPDRHQIVYIRIPKNDYTTVAGSYCDLERSRRNTFAMLLDKVGRFVRLLY
jgi:cell division protein FtsL